MFNLFKEEGKMDPIFVCEGKGDPPLPTVDVDDDVLLLISPLLKIELFLKHDNFFFLFCAQHSDRSDSFCRG